MPIAISLPLLKSIGQYNINLVDMRMKTIISYHIIQIDCITYIIRIRYINL